LTLELGPLSQDSKVAACVTEQRSHDLVQPESEREELGKDSTEDPAEIQNVELEQDCETHAGETEAAERAEPTRVPSDQREERAGQAEVVADEPQPEESGDQVESSFQTFLDKYFILETRTQCNKKYS
jgi:hypothetical protein